VIQDTRQHATISEEDLLTYSINVHNKGTLLETVTTSGEFID
jgi:hypothetical protein